MGLLDNQTQQSYYDGDNFGGYQFVSLNDIVNQFMIIYVGEDKIVSKARRTDVAFHAQRALAELSFDTFKSVKSQEITLPPSNTMVLPQDYVNYTKVCWVDGSGIERPLYPTKHTSNPTPIFQNENEEYKLTAVGTTTHQSNVVVLDSEYKDIQVGMIAANDIFAPQPGGVAVVQSVSNDNGITTITLGGAGTAATTPNLLAFNSNLDTGIKVTFNFYKENESLLLEKTAVVLENITWAAFDRALTQSPNTDVSSIKVGMLVSHTAFPVGTVVVDVTDNIIFVSNAAFPASTSTTNEVTFVSTPNDSTTWDSYSSDTSSTSDANAYNYDTDVYDFNLGQRYGLEPSHSQSNGTYYIDNLKGLIHFSSNVSGKTIILKYISDSLGTDGEMQVHKFAEEAMYRWILHAIAAGRVQTQQIVPRLKKEKTAAIRQAKLRLSNIKLEELTQILRGKSKHIKY